MLLKEFLEKLEKKIPLNYACDWDNVGLLIEPNSEFRIDKILLTNDLTEPVMDEAIELKANLIISYHPPLFRPFKSIRQSYWKDRILAKCLSNQIAVYSPHTALDAIHGGINDWLLKPFQCKQIEPVEECFTKLNENTNLYSIKFRFDQLGSAENQLKIIEEKIRQPDSLSTIVDVLEKEHAQILSVTKSTKQPIVSEGMGRIGTLSNKMSIRQIIMQVKEHLGLDRLRLALADNHNEETLISSIGVCAGSGASVLRKAKADLLITGEMSHHDILDFKHNKTTVILCEHTNTERGYLKDSLYQYLLDNFANIQIFIAKSDHDPVRII